MRDLASSSVASFGVDPPTVQYGRRTTTLETRHTKSFVFATTMMDDLFGADAWGEEVRYELDRVV
jgi:hypothetical protein